MKQNKSFKQDFIINKDYTINQNLSKNCDNLNLKPQKKKHKFTKIFGGVSLAVFMGVSTLCGVVLIQKSQSIALTFDSFSTNINSSFGLCPETDPVIFTTKTGLDIKFGGATLSNGALTGFTYFTMGNYGGTPVNWVVIGRHSSTTTGTTTYYPSIFTESLATFFTGIPLSSTILNWMNTQYEIKSPAGKLLSNYNELPQVVGENNIHEQLNITLSSKEATGSTIDNELEPGEVLVLSETALGSGHIMGNYNGSGLKTHVDKLFTTNLNFTYKEKALIRPKTLINYYSSSSTTENAYLFPMATTSRSSAQNFCYETYLTTDQRHLGSQHTTRSCSSSDNTPFIVLATGSYQGTIQSVVAVNGGVGSFLVRPAFVTKLI